MRSYELRGPQTQLPVLEYDHKNLVDSFLRIYQFESAASTS